MSVSERGETACCMMVPLREREKREAMHRKELWRRRRTVEVVPSVKVFSSYDLFATFLKYVNVHGYASGCSSTSSSAIVIGEGEERE